MQVKPGNEASQKHPQVYSSDCLEPSVVTLFEQLRMVV